MHFSNVFFGLSDQFIADTNIMRNKQHRHIFCSKNSVKYAPHQKIFHSAIWRFM
jgi:hypothetical protein